MNDRSIALYILTSVTVVATLIYGVFGYQDTKRIVDNIYQDHRLLAEHVVTSVDPAKPITPLLIYASLETDTMVARNNRSASALAARTWLRYSLTIVGLILSVFGAAFVLGQITIGPTAVQGQTSGASVNISTTSPGILLAALGVLVIVLPAIITQEIETRDAATYGVLSPLAVTDTPRVSDTSLSDDEIIERLRSGK